MKPVDPFAPPHQREAGEGRCRVARLQRVAVYMPKDREYRVRYADGTCSPWKLATGKTLITAPSEDGSIEWRTPVTGPKPTKIPPFLHVVGGKG